MKVLVAEDDPAVRGLLAEILGQDGHEVILTADGDAAVFAHGHILRILGARWLGLEPRSGGMLALSTAAVCELGFERERHVVWLWNDTGHLGGV